MLAVFQHPFADLRGFVGPRSARLPVPIFPLSPAGRQFVRSSGEVARRPKGGVAEWLGEEFFARATNAIRFQDRLGDARLGNGAGLRIVRTYRRFHSDGRAARLDIGLAVRGATREPMPATVREFVSAVPAIADLPVRISSEARGRERRLVDAGPALARHYFLATSSRKQVPEKVEPWWFQAGDPLVLLEIAETANRVLPDHASTIMDDDEGVSLFHVWLGLRGRPCSTWIIACTPRAPQDKLRRLRIHLARMHAERHCLRSLLQAIQDNRMPLGARGELPDEVQLYLKATVDLLQKPARDGVDQAAMLGKAREAFGMALEGDTGTLGLMRRQVAAKVEAFVKTARATAFVVQHFEGDYVNKSIQLGNLSVAGDFTQVVADNISNSFNTAAASDAKAELKQALQQLSIEVANLAKRLPPEKAEQVTNDLRSLTSEALAKEPRKAWYELSAKGMVEAAKTVADMVPSISKAVAGVLALLV